MRGYLIIHLVFLLVGSKVSYCHESLDSDVSYATKNEEESQKSSSSESQEALWSEWSEWSPCSRTCDGGTAYQLRRCNGILGCSGNIVRYRLCNMQACPDPIDFREYQCNSYNDVPYNGELFKWTTYHDPEEPCQLKCKSHTDIIATLSPSVKDGTRCRPGSLDLCVDGLCQSVGCDLMIGSDAKVDTCGVCGGDGSSCTQPLYHWIVEPASLCSATCGTGYKMSQVKCRNVVTGADVEEQFCDDSLKPVIEVIKCNIHPCPAKWIPESWSHCSKTCSGGIKQRNVVCMQMINSTLSKVSENNCKGMKPRTSEPCNNSPCPPTWKTGQWSKCSVTCGDGIQIRNVTCKSDQEIIESNATCDESMKPDTFQPCSTGVPCSSLYPEEMLDLDETLRILHPYPPFHPVAEKLIGEQVVTSSLSSSEPSYKPEPWGECSVTCGEGFRKRDVPCTVFLEGSRLLAKVPDLYCQGKKPSTTERCVQQPCSSPMTNRMDTGEDSYSDATYSDPYRSQYSETHIKVAPHRSGKTYVWKTQGYTHCSASCLGGVQESLIMCVQEDDQKVVSPFLCSSETRPEALTRTCNLDPCPPRWNHSEFAPCSKPCGIGIQTREVNCIHELLRGGGGTVVVPNSKCPHPPPIDRQYCNILDCPVAWHTLDWSKCSKRCGGGVKERLVECKQVMAQNHIVPRPVSQCPKNKPPEKRPCNTKPCPSDDQRPSISSHSELYVQPPAKRKVSLKIGGSAHIYFGTQVKIKCPVKKFDRSKIQWAKDHKLIASSKKYKISKKGALRIQTVTYGDTGVFTCLAGRSSADIAITIKGRPGEYLSSEEMEKQTSNQLDPGMNEAGGRPQLMPGDAESQEQRHIDLPGSRPDLPRPDRPKHDNSWPHQNTHTSTTSISDQSLASYRGPHVMMEDFKEVKSFPLISSYVESTSESPIVSVVLGKGGVGDLKFHWITLEWSPCYQPCQGYHFQKREVYCVVQLNNMTERVSDHLCQDAGMSEPARLRSCKFDSCPHWVTSMWTPCDHSNCIREDTAMQKRTASCQSWNGTVINESWCAGINKPRTRQECFIKLCKPSWKVGVWSECTAPCSKKGVKYRILQCVWSGTNNPAGNACQDITRPNVIKSCKGLPCFKNSVCKNKSIFCTNLHPNYICGNRRYRLQCCESCRNNH